MGSLFCMLLIDLAPPYTAVFLKKVYLVLMSHMPIEFTSSSEVFISHHYFNFLALYLSFIFMATFALESPLSRVYYEVLSYLNCVPYYKLCRWPYLSSGALVYIFHLFLECHNVPALPATPSDAVLNIIICFCTHHESYSPEVIIYLSSAVECCCFESGEVFLLPYPQKLLTHAEKCTYYRVLCHTASWQRL